MHQSSQGADVDNSILEAPRLVLQSKHPNSKELRRELRKRGFMVENYVVSKSSSRQYVLSMSEKLYVKLVIQHNFPLVRFKECLPIHRLLIIQAALDFVKRCEVSLGVEDVWVAHDEKAYNALFQSNDAQSTTDKIFSVFKYTSKVDSIAAYFGPQISLYYAWMDHYTESLAIPAIAGLALTAHLYLTNSSESAFMPFFAVLIAIWGTAFMEFWKGKCARKAFVWGVLGVEDDEADIELTKSSTKESSTRTIRLILSFVGTMSIIYLLLQCMLYFVDFHMRSEEIYGKDSWLRFYPSTVYSVLPVVFPMLFEPIASFLTSFECHSTKAEEERFMVLKRFSLQFINRFSALLYVAFWKRDVDMLRSLLISLLATGALINNFTELGVPLIKTFVKRSSSTILAVIKQRLPPVHKILVKINIADDSDDSAAAPQKAHPEDAPTRMTPQEVAAMLNRENALESYSLDDDYLEMVLQFGYVTMFAVVFPLTPVLALVNNFFEARVDLLKLSQCRRPRVLLRSTIGAWQTCLEMVSFVAVLTNCFLLLQVSSHLHTIIPNSLASYIESDQSKFLAMVVLEHALLGVKVVLMHVIDDVPRDIQEELARQRIAEKQRSSDERVQRMIRLSQGNTTGGGEGSHEVESEEASAAAFKQALEVKRLQQQLVSPFSFNPMSVLSLFTAPAALHYAQVSPYVYVPVAAMLLSYFQASKDRFDRQAAVGIVSDPSLVKFVVKEMPSWVSDADFQRVEWLNSILQQLWPFVSNGIEKLVKEKVKPVFDNVKPSMLTELGLTHCNLGAIAPKIVGIKYLSAAGDSNVRFELELHWAGDPLITLRAATMALPLLSIELSNLQFTATLRFELLDLTNTLPGFRALSLTILNSSGKKFFVDFSLKVAGLDVMNLGAGEYNIMNLVRSTIFKALETTLIYPHKVVVPIDKNSSAEDFNSSEPTATLRLVVESAEGLKAVNMLSVGTSDPYVNVSVNNKCAQKMEATKIKRGTINPVWNEAFSFQIVDSSMETVEFEIMDSDIGIDSKLGAATLRLKGLPFNVPTQKVLAVREGKGTLTVTATLFSLKVGAKAASGVGLQVDPSIARGDILFDLEEHDLEDNSQLEKFDNFAPHSADENGSSLSAIQQPDGSPAPSPAPVNRAELMKRQMTVKTKSQQNMCSGLLVVSMIRAKNLKPPSSVTSWFDSSFRPFIEVTVGGSVEKTQALKNTLHPQFQDTLQFYLTDMREETLHLRVLERNKITSNVLLGEVFQPLADTALLKQRVAEITLPVKGSASNAEVSFKLAFVIAADGSAGRITNDASPKRG